MRRKELDVPNFVPVPIRKITWENVYEREAELIKKERYASFILSLSVIVMIACIVGLGVIVYTLRCL